MVKLRKRVWCTCQFEGFHCWPDAPERHIYLRYVHRHVFHVRVEWEVSHNERELEFIELKRKTLDHIRLIKNGNVVDNWSCEHWAEELLKQLQACSVTVSEDGENGATVERI